MKNCPECGLQMIADLFGVLKCYACTPKRSTSAGDTVYKAPLPTDPDWLQACQSMPTTHIIRGRQGLHPTTGKPLHPDAELTCRGCQWLERKHRSKTYYKCGQSRQTGGPATDVKLRYRACTMYTAKIDPPF